MFDSPHLKGNYIVCGGDFNKDLLGKSEDIFGVSGQEYTWAQPFPRSILDNEPFELAVPFDPLRPVPSCRNADGPFTEEQFVLTVDGFIVSDNVTVEKSAVCDTAFRYSDHNPVELSFRLN